MFRRSSPGGGTIWTSDSCSVWPSSSECGSCGSLLATIDLLIDHSQDGRMCRIDVSGVGATRPSAAVLSPSVMTDEWMRMERGRPACLSNKASILSCGISSIIHVTLVTRWFGSVVTSSVSRVHRLILNIL